MTTKAPTASAASRKWNKSKAQSKKTVEKPAKFAEDTSELPTVALANADGNNSNALTIADGNNGGARAPIPKATMTDADSNANASTEPTGVGNKSVTDGKVVKSERLEWDTGMIEYALELRFDTTKTHGKRFLNVKNAADMNKAWAHVYAAFKEKYPNAPLENRDKISSKIDKLKKEYRTCINKFKETGNHLEDEFESDDFKVTFKKDVSFKEFKWLPPYWEALLGAFASRAGMCSAILGQSGENAQQSGSLENPVCLEGEDETSSTSPTMESSFEFGSPKTPAKKETSLDFGSPKTPASRKSKMQEDMDDMMMRG
jgi:hypothetical protein